MHGVVWEGRLYRVGCCGEEVCVGWGVVGRKFV